MRPVQDQAKMNARVLVHMINFDSSCLMFLDGSCLPYTLHPHPFLYTVISVEMLLRFVFKLTLCTGFFVIYFMKLLIIYIIHIILSVININSNTGEKILLCELLLMCDCVDWLAYQINFFCL